MVYQNFDEYYFSERQKGVLLGKHQVFTELVIDQLPELGPAYKQLLDISWTARYLNYQYGKNVSNSAKKKLIKIKKGCTKNITKKSKVTKKK